MAKDWPIKLQMQNNLNIIGADLGKNIHTLLIK